MNGDDSEGGMLPEGFDELAAGPHLAAVVAGVDRGRLDDHDLVRLLQAEDRLVSHFQARRAASMVAIAERADWGEFAALEIAAALRLTRAGAETELGIAAQLHALPALGAQLSQGAIDWRRARTTVDGVAHLDIDAAQRVIDEITEHLPDLTSGQIRALIRRVCLTHDPADANERMCHRIAERTVQAYPSPEGTAHLSISDVPAERAAAAMAHINHLARGLTGDGRTIDQRRADVALDLLCGTGPPVGRGMVDITVDLATLIGLETGGGELGGWGPVVAETARAVAAAQTDGAWQATVAMPDGTTHTTALRRRPRASQARTVVDRYPRCVFPGCRHPARDCDLDHTIAHADGGPSVPENLAPLCRHHHRAKHASGWTYRIDDDGTVHWKSPADHDYTTSGRDP